MEIPLICDSLTHDAYVVFSIDKYGNKTILIHRPKRDEELENGTWLQGKLSYYRLTVYSANRLNRLLCMEGWLTYAKQIDHADYLSGEPDFDYKYHWEFEVHTQYYNFPKSVHSFINSAYRCGQYDIETRD